mgnify:CR=1 FL=1
MIKHSVILLKRDNKRILNVKNKIQSCVPNLNIFNAFDFQQDDINSFCFKNKIEISQTYKENGAKLGGIANIISHIKLWQHMVKNKIPEMVILEDDAKINSGHFVHLNKLKKDLSEDYNICLMYVEKRKYRNDINVQTEKKYINKGYKNSGMVCYLISLKGAKYMIKEFKTIKQLIDVQINQLTKQSDGNHKIFCAKYPFVSMNKLTSNVSTTKKYLSD